MLNSCHPLGCAPSNRLRDPRASLSRSYGGNIAEFLQRHSLKRLGMLYLSTCVGFGYGLMRELFPGTGSLQRKSSNPEQLIQRVTIHWPTNINVVPIDYAFRPRLRGRLTLRRLTLRRNPWTFGDTVFHSVCRYSCQHSHFRGLQKPSRVFLHRQNGTLRYRALHSAPKASARGLSPVTSSAQKPLT